jgi:dTDP-4-dehydrorhamnose 3,5-epimerase
MWNNNLVIFEELSLRGAWKITSVKHHDLRGSFSEWFKREDIRKFTTLDFKVEQANVSFSSKGTIRGLHYSLARSGQDKWVTCILGKIIDVIVDVRKGSPTFGQWESVELDANNNQSVFISSGLAHGFASLENNSCVSYLLSSAYLPSEEFGVNPLDSDLNIEWGLPMRKFVLSEKDKNAPMLITQIESNQLPLYPKFV